MRLQLFLTAGIDERNEGDRRNGACFRPVQVKDATAFGNVLTWTGLIRRNWEGPTYMPLLKDKSGANAVEFAVVLPVLLLIVLGIIQFGVIFFTYNNMVQAARKLAPLRRGFSFACGCP